MNASSLQTLQEEFQAYVLQQPSHVGQRIVDDARLGASVRLAIYADAYRLRLLEALGTDFPALHRLAGDEKFARLGRDYIDAHPSLHFSVRYFGQGLSDFLTARDEPLLADMAALEWALAHAFDAADDPMLSEQELAGLPAGAWPGMRLRFHDSVQRCEFTWNVTDIWSANDKSVALPSAAAAPASFLIWRQDLQCYFRKLPTAEAAMLDTLLAGQDFSAACERLCVSIAPEEVGLHAASLLKTWIAGGIISAVAE